MEGVDIGRGGASKGGGVLGEGGEMGASRKTEGDRSGVPELCGETGIIWRGELISDDSVSLAVFSGWSRLRAIPLTDVAALRRWRRRMGEYSYGHPELSRRVVYLDVQVLTGPTLLLWGDSV